MHRLALTQNRIVLPFRPQAHVLRTLQHHVARRSARHYARPASAVLETAVTSSESDSFGKQNPEAQQLMPGELDARNFKQHWSVDLWQTFDPKTWLSDVADDGLPTTARLQSFADTLSTAISRGGVFADSQSTTYWAYHILRSGFFFTQGFAGLTYARQQLADTQSSGIFNRLEAMARNGWQGPLAEAALMFYSDLENIKEGRYSLPWDMTTATHRQFNPLFVLSRTARFVREATDTLRRRDRNTPEDVWLRSSVLPDYFQNTFHYQTDGWLSQTSAKVYENSTETLFVGRQDAMQRTTLVPLSDYMADKDASQVRALEVACGTGRFATFVKDNYPTLDLTVSDLSPFYLAEARENMKYWKSQRATALTLPGVDGNGTTFLQTPAEAIESPDASYDVVYSIYLFHELPEDVRRKAASEMARVLKPGGVLVLTDSMQLGDRKVYEKTMGNFGDFNEPYYRNYISTDLGALFKEFGLEPDMRLLASTSKTLSFRKPLPEDKAAPAPASDDAGVNVQVEMQQPPLGDPNMN